MRTLRGHLRQSAKNAIPAWLARRRLEPRQSRSLLLTFDDGPHDAITPAVLDRLERSRAQAVFFVIGRAAQRRPDLLRAIVDRGHLLGNHSYSHPNDGAFAFASYREELDRCQEVIRHAVSQTPRWFRPPLGVLSPAAVLASRSLGLRCMLWSSEGGEWGDRKSEDARSIATRLRETVRGRDIVLLHDNNPKVPEILDYFLPYLVERGDDLGRAVESIR